MKLHFIENNKKCFLVAPFVGAWIEIGTNKLQIRKGGTVAPFVGAWIEILWLPTGPKGPAGRSLRGSVD